VTVPPGSSWEEKARSVRYEALDRSRHPGEWMLTAHTSDDQAETVIDHLLRGSGLDGLRGIPARRGAFARPLLGVSRSTTREIATLASLPWEDDPLNLAPEPLRNRIRSHLLPELERYNRRIRSALAATASLVAAEVDYLESAASSPVEVLEEGAAVAASLLTTVDPALGGRLARRLLATAGLEHPSRESVEGVMEVARGERARSEPGGGLSARRRGALVVVEHQPQAAPDSVPLEQPGVTPFGRWRFHAFLADSPPEAMPLSAAWMVADADEAASLMVEPAGRHPETARILAKAGVGRDDRGRHPVVVGARGPIWIPGVRRLGTGWADAGTRRYLVIRSWTERSWRSWRR
ncbi:MAG: ATP-binding protein, partial [Actinomycetota bacterium]